jgi:biopolymer transport protein ExbB/TolQ
MDIAIGRETDRLTRGLTVLATVGATAPFVGLFGTVWGIMHAFERDRAAAEHLAGGRRARHRRGAAGHRLGLWPRSRR